MEWRGQWLLCAWEWESHHRLHQPGSDREILSGGEDARRVGEDRPSQRTKARLPAHVVVYYVIALALYMRPSCREVLRCLREGVQWLLDGSTLDVADTAENEKAYARPGASRGSSAFPKSALWGLLENGIRAVGCADGAVRYRRDHAGAGGGAALRKGMLCLADRFFPSYQLWQAAAQTGAELLWRTRQNAHLEVDRRLADGSYLSRLYASTSDRRNERKAMVVRAIDYRLKDVPDAEPVYRLITTILDPTQAPAPELAALYHERWEK